jgi:hypothetical protein
MREQSSISDKPIFLDETGLRWRLVRIVLLSLITTVLILPIALTISIPAPASSYKMPLKHMNYRALYDSQIRAR